MGLNIAKEKDKLAEYANLEHLSEQLLSKATVLEKQRFALSDLEKNIKIFKEKLSQEKQELESLKDIHVENEQSENKRDKLLTKELNLSELLDAYNNYTNLLNLYNKAKGEYEKAQANNRTLSGEAQRIEKVFLDEQAGILAKTLVEGKPCPVCGSPKHPFPAVATDEAPTETKVKQAKAFAQEAQEDAHKARPLCRRA